MSAVLSIRIDLPGGVRMGPGKAALLRAIGATGSISAAAGELEMSYPRAWKLVQELNDVFIEPLVETRQGGVNRGGASLTKVGEEVLALYEQVVASAEDGAEASLRDLSRRINIQHNKTQRS